MENKIGLDAAIRAIETSERVDNSVDSYEYNKEGNILLLTSGFTGNVSVYHPVVDKKGYIHPFFNKD